MYFMIILLPLLGSIICGFFGRKIGNNGAKLIASLCVILTTMFALVLVFEVAFNNIAVDINLSRWLDSDFFNILWDFRVDALTVYFRGVFYITKIEAVLVLIQLYKNKFIKNFLIYCLGYSPFNSYVLRFPYNLTNKIRNKGMNYSTISNIYLNNEKGSLDSNFLQWFVGFTDAEGNFIINRILKTDKLTISTFSFMFKITLHKKLLALNNTGTSIPFLSMNNQHYFHKGVRYFSFTSDGSTLDTLNPHWVTGFVDAEGSFIIIVCRQPGSTGWRVSPLFTLHLHVKDLALLYKIKSFFGIGKIYVGKKSISFTVKRFDEIVNIVIPHFIKYPLRSAKSIDFNLWSQCVEIMTKKEHLTILGLNKIVGLKSALNKGLSEDLVKSFPNVNFMKRPIFEMTGEPLNPYWVSGFTEGDGSFYISISKKTRYVRMFYSIKLNNRETPLIIRIQEYFKHKGSIVNDNTNNIIQYNISSKNDINEVIIPQFDTYVFCGNKLTNFLIWKEILLLVNCKDHLTTEGLNKIMYLESTLNKWDI